MRIDVFLTEKGYCQSRTEAKGLITSGAVEYNGRLITKPSFDIPGDASNLKVDRSSIRFASRGGEKLAFAIDRFNINAKGRSCIDVGASSGGFTDCLLQCGAERVLSVDSGSGQIVERLRCDPRVTVYEGYNARYMKREDFAYVPNLAVMDVSFISATLIITSLYDVLDGESDFICLIKPQFEVGKSGIGKGGVVKDEMIRKSAVEKVTSFAESIGFSTVGVSTSPILGGDGNVEFLAHFRKGIK